MRTSVRGPILIAVLALLWGSNFLWIKIALEGFTPIQLTAGRMVLGAAVLLAIMAVRRERLPRGWAVWGHLTVAALVANAAPYLLFALGETLVDSGIAGVANATTPLWTLVLVLVFRTQKTISRHQLLGFALAFVGCLLIFSPWAGDAPNGIGVAFCLIAALSYAAAYLYMSRHLTPRPITPTVLAAAQLIPASAWTLLALPFDAADPTAARTAGPWIALGILGAVGTGSAYVINYALVRTEGPAGASIVTYLVPVASLTLGALAVNESISVYSATGALAILGGVALSRRGSIRQSNNRTQATKTADNAFNGGRSQ